jgi:DNA-binding transcriptional ArsR family regulator
MTAHELGTTVGAWNSLVRRARMADKQKLAALLVSSYADPDGTGIHCGVARLAVDLGASYRTAQRYLSWLREVGLIELVREGNRRRRLSDEYRLIIGPDVMEHIDVLHPDAYESARSELRDARSSRRDQASSRVASDRPSNRTDQASPKNGVRSGGPGRDQASSRVSYKDRDQASNEGRSGVTQDVPPPNRRTSPKRSTSPADDEDLSAAVTPSRATPPRTPAPKKCPDGLSAAVRPDGKPECPICRRRQARPGIEVPLAPVIPLDSRRIS